MVPPGRQDEGGAGQGGDIPPTITTPKQQVEEVERPSGLASVLKDGDPGASSLGFTGGLSDAWLVV